MSDDPPKAFLGGQTDAVFKRAARVADGWMMGGGPPEMFGAAREKLEAAWREAGREGTPYKASLTYHALAKDPEAAARASIGNYYSFVPQYEEMVCGGYREGTGRDPRACAHSRSRAPTS